MSEGVFLISTNSKEKELCVIEKENFQSVPEKIHVPPVSCNQSKRKKMVTIIASTSYASRKRVKDTEIFQELEESTDSDVTIFSSEEDEDGNEPKSDEDGQWMTILKQIKMEALVLAAQNSSSEMD
jgi:hypothetical protein